MTLLLSGRWPRILMCHLVVLAAVASAPAGEPPPVRVEAFGAAADDGDSDSAAMTRAIRSLQPGQTLLFPKGVYHLDAVVWIEKARNIRLLGEPGAVIKKTGRFQFMLAFIASSDVTIEGLSFEGATTNREAVVWGEEGVYFGSSARSTIKNCRFANFGDAAVRITTSLVRGACDSLDGKILNCRFDNVTQVTTTQGMEGNYAGTDGMLIQGNVFDNLKASIKVAARAPTTGSRIIGNHIRSSRRDGIQVESVSDVRIEGNRLERIAGSAILLNVNPHVPPDSPGFAWDRVAVRDNHIRQAGRGVQVYLKPYADGSEFDMTGLEITGNEFQDITDVNAEAVIWLGNTGHKTFIHPTIAENKFKNTQKLQLVRCPPGTDVRGSDRR